MKDYFKNSANTAPLLVLGIFVLLLVSRLIDTTLLNRENEYVAVIVLQLVIFLLPAAFYIKALELDFGRFRLSAFGPGHLLLLVSALISLTAGTILIEFYTVGGEALDRNYDLWGVFISKNEGTVASTIYLILAYASLPAAIAVHLWHNLVGLFGRPYMQTLADLGGDKFFMTILTAVFLLFTGIFAAEAARLYKNYARLDLSSAYKEIDPPYPPADADSTPLEELAAKHPRIAATCGAIFSFPSLVCYVAYTAAVFIEF